MGGNVVQQHIDDLIAASDTRTRYQSERALTAIGETAVLPLLELLKTGNTIQRSSAIRSLSTIGDQRATEPLIALLQNADEEPSVRAWAVKYCSFLRDQHFIPILLTHFDDTDVGKYVKAVLRGNPFLSDLAQNYLQEMLSQATPDQTHDEFQSQLDYIIVGSKVEQYGKLLYNSTEKKVEILGDQLYDPHQQPTAISKLKQFAGQCRLNRDLQDLLVEQLMFILDASDDPALRKSVISLLDSLDRHEPNRDFKLKLVDMMQHDGDMDIRMEAMATASRLAGRSHPTLESSILDSLIDIIPSDEPEPIRLQAIHSLKDFPRRQRVHDVLKPLVDEESSVSAAAKATLQATGYSLDLQNEKCVVCGLTQDRVRLYNCQTCGTPICSGHMWPSESRMKPPGVFCSFECFHKSGLPTNPQYW